MTKSLMMGTAAGRLIPGTVISLWDIMEIFHASLFIAHISNIDRNYGFLSKLSPWLSSFVLKRKGLDINEIDSVYAFMERSCASLELVSSLATVRKMRESIQHGRYDKFFASGEELSSRFKDKMEGRCVFVLTLKECEQIRNPRNGWAEIIYRFPDCVTDVEEAIRCYAFGRYAAAVFHSLQVVEIGLIELGRVIGATDHQTGWNATTKRLSIILKTNYHDMTPFQKQHHKFMEQIDALIKSLKNAWRNKVSHAQDKLALLRTDFTPSIAEEILVASRSFMRRLAAEAPTTPDPDV